MFWRNKRKKKNSDRTRNPYLRNLIFALIFIILVLPFTGIAMGIFREWYYEFSDDSLLTQKSCALPCWNGLIPGKSTIEDVRDVLSNLPGASRMYFHESSFYGDRQYVLFGLPSPKESRIILKNGVIYEMEIISEIDFSIQDVIRPYGVPDGITIQYYFSPHSADFSVDIEMYYPKIGLIAEYRLIESNYTLGTTVELPLSTHGYRFTLVPSASTIPGILYYQGWEGKSLSQFMSKVITGWPGTDSIIIYDGSLDQPHLILTVTPVPQ